MNIFQDAVLAKQQQIARRIQVNRAMRDLIGRHRAALSQFEKNVAACDDELAILELEDAMLVAQDKFLDEQEALVADARASGIWGDMSDLCQLISFINGRAVAPIQPRSAAASLPQTLRMAASSVATQPPAAAQPPVAQPRVVIDDGDLSIVEETRPARKRRFVNYRPPRSEEASGSETLGHEDDVDDQTTEQSQSGDDSFVDAGEQLDSSDSEYGPNEQTECEEITTVSDSKQPSELPSREEVSDGWMIHTPRRRTRNSTISLRDACEFALAGDYEPLATYYNTKLNSSAVHCGAPLDSARMARYEELVAAAKAESLAIAQLVGGAEHTRCLMCNTLKHCSNEVLVAGKRIGYVGSHCAVRLRYIRSAGKAAATICDTLEAAPAEDRADLLRVLTDRVEQDYAALLDK